MSIRSSRFTVSSLLGLLALTPLLAAPHTLTAQADLNGDGRPETIEAKATDTAFSVRIGTHTLVTGALASPDCLQKLTVVDIDTHDHYHELAVRIAEGSDTTSNIYGFDGTRVLAMGELSLEPSFPGNGMVYVTSWGGFWDRLDKYQLNAQTHKLVLVKQPFYYVGKESTVTVSLPIYADKNKKQLVANLLPNSRVLVLLNSDSWYLLKSHTGLVGWIPEDQLTTQHFPDLKWGG